MQTYAFVQDSDNIVYTLIQGPDNFNPYECYKGSLPPGNFILSPDNVLPGDSYINEQFVLLKRPTIPITKLAFLRRFTAEERIAIRNTSDPIINDFMELLNHAEEIIIDDPDIVAAVNYFESLELIAPSRKEEILG